MNEFNFSARFADTVARMEKRQTIRARGKRRPPRPGEPLQLYTGMRTVQCRKLAEVVCASVEPISISCLTRTVSMITGEGSLARWQSLDDDELDTLAKADGFSGSLEFFEWFHGNYGRSVSGYLIKW